MNILKEKDGTYSWRKIITCYALLQIIISFNAYQFFNFKILPKMYFGLLSLIITFYFSKEYLQRKKNKNDNN